MSPPRWFIALLPPQDVQDYANRIKQEFCDRFGSRAAQKSPPHITLQPPFEWDRAELPRLATCLQTFAAAQPPVPVTLSGFGAFPPRVIYLNVLRTPALLQLQKALMTYLETELNLADPRSRQRPFAPHLTVAFRDLTKQNFHAAWPEYASQTVEFAFTVPALTLLLHDGRRWNAYQDFDLGKSLPPETEI